jgi:hypothetical protein
VRGLGGVAVGSMVVALAACGAGDDEASSADRTSTTSVGRSTTTAPPSPSSTASTSTSSPWTSVTRGSRWPKGLAKIVAVALVLVSTAACGGGEEGTQPVPDASTFDEGRFDELPEYPRADPFGRRSEKDGIVSRSYRATGVTPERLIEWYTDALGEEGWARTAPRFREPGDGRADFVLDDWRLELSATDIKDRQIPSSTKYTVQYSLVLRPR